MSIFKMYTDLEQQFVAIQITSFSGKALLMSATVPKHILHILQQHSSVLKGPKWPCQQSTPVTYLKHMKEKKYDKGILNRGTAEILQQVRMETIWLLLRGRAA